jgi:hypothetical protein
LVMAVMVLVAASAVWMATATFVQMGTDMAIPLRGAG